jgi:heptosyltransferase-1
VKQRFPECEIDWLVENRWRELLVDNPSLHRVIDVDTLEWRKRPFSPAVWSALADRLAALRECHYDYALDLQGAVKSAVACAVSGARQTIGFDTPWVKEAPSAALYTRRVRVTAQHVVDANLELAAALGARRGEVRFPLPPGDSSLLAPQLPTSSFAVFNPGAGWRSKCWPPENYAALADALDAEFQIPVVLNLGPGEEPLASEIENACRRANPQRFSGTLTALIALLRRSRLMVGPDTGPLHLAAALGVPTVGLFGPTDPNRNGPYGRRQRSLRSSGVVTTYRHSSEEGVEMRKITPEQVLEAIRELFHE